MSHVANVATPFHYNCMAEPCRNARRSAVTALYYAEQIGCTSSADRGGARVWRTIGGSNEKYIHGENKRDLSVVLLGEFSACSTEQMVLFSSHRSVGSV